MAKGQLKYRNPNYVEGGDEPKWISLGVSGGSSGGNGGSGDTGGNVKQYETVNVSISADNGQSITADVTVNGETKSVTSGSSVPWEVEYGTEYSVSVGAVDGFAAPEALSFTAGQSTRNVELVYAFSGPYITTIRIDQNISDSATMITRIVDQGGIEKIRANSHRYTGKLNSEDVMVLKQLDDSDGNRYLDGTLATNLGIDVWMKLPHFYWRCTQHDTDVWDFDLAYGSKPDNTYKEWDGKDLIGVYKCDAGSSNPLSLRSVSYQAPAVNFLHSEFKAGATKRGDGYSLVKWKHHCMMAMLFYTWYGTTDAIAVLGRGAPSIEMSSGSTNYLGMEDTVAGINGEVGAINFWGLEGWYGIVFEFIENVEVDILSGQWNITEDDNSVRTINAKVESGNWIRKLFFGENLDLIPIETGSSSTVGFCDYFYPSNEENDLQLSRSGFNNVSNIGVATLSCTIENAGTNFGSRLAYRGDYIIEQ